MTEPRWVRLVHSETSVTSFIRAERIVAVMDDTEYNKPRCNMYIDGAVTQQIDCSAEELMTQLNLATVEP